MKLLADEDFDFRVVHRLRERGHDVLTVIEARRRGLRDDEQLAFATEEDRVFLTVNRADFHALHRKVQGHAGIVTCTRDADVEALAARIDAALAGRDDMPGELIRVVRGTPAR